MRQNDALAQTRIFLQQQQQKKACKILNISRKPIACTHISLDLLFYFVVFLIYKACSIQKKSTFFFKQ